MALALALRFTVFLGAKEGQLAGLAVAYAMGTWLPIMVLNLVESRHLGSYLRSCHRNRWEELNYIPVLGCVGHNGFRMVRWLYSKEDFGDPKVVTMKAEYRGFVRLAMAVFFSYLVIMPVLFGL